MITLQKGLEIHPLNQTDSGVIVSLGIPRSRLPKVEQRQNAVNGIAQNHTWLAIKSLRDVETDVPMQNIERARVTRQFSQLRFATDALGRESCLNRTHK